MKLVTTQALPESAVAELCDIDPDLTLVNVDLRDWDTSALELADADVLMGSFGGGSFDTFERVVRAAPHARWLHTSSAGVDELFGPALDASNLILTCGKGYAVANLLAEHALALILALLHGVVPSARRDHWDRDGFPHGFGEMEGKTLGIIGFGGVGENLAKKANAFGTSVLGVRTKASDAPDGVEAVWGPEGTPELLRRSDIVVLILPATPDTLGTFGEAQLRQMKPDALLINVGRGQVCDGDALERALVEGWIAGAGLDVMPEEPWPASSPLWKMDNVLITPHIAGNSPQRQGRNVATFVDNYRRFVAGEPMRSVVDRNKGY